MGLGWGCVLVYLQMPVNPEESVLGMSFPHGQLWMGLGNFQKLK